MLVECSKLDRQGLRIDWSPGWPCLVCLSNLWCVYLSGTILNGAELLHREGFELAREVYACCSTHAAGRQVGCRDT